MKTWMIYSIITLFLWGFWGFLGKAAAENLPSRTLLLLACLGFALAFPIVYTMYPKSMVFNLKNPYTFAALLSGLAAGTGVIFFNIALYKGSASRVVAFTAMYPLVTVVLSYALLKETLSIYTIGGIFCALAAAVLLSI